MRVVKAGKVGGLAYPIMLQALLYDSAAPGPLGLLTLTRLLLHTSDHSKKCDFSVSSHSSMKVTTKNHPHIMPPFSHGRHVLTHVVLQPRAGPRGAVGLPSAASRMVSALRCTAPHEKRRPSCSYARLSERPLDHRSSSGLL